MTTEKAIEIIQNQIVKLENPKNQNHHWILETRTYLKKIFGEDSPQEKSLQHLSFSEIAPLESKLSKKVEGTKQFLESCISTINNIGVYKPKKENWFSELPNWSINLGLPAICFLAFSAGVLFTNNTNSELRNENSNLKEQLLLISTDTIPKQHKNLSDKPKD